MPYDFNFNPPTNPSVPYPPLGGYTELPWTTSTNAQPTGAPHAFNGCRPLHTSTYLPLSASEFYLNASGSGISGRLCIEADGDEGAEGVRVDVTMYYTDSRLAGNAKVRSGQPGAGRHGLTFVTPRVLIPTQRVFFHVRIHFPSRRNGQPPLEIPRFMTDLPQFVHEISHLGDAVHFDYISLAASNAAITIYELSANQISLRTSNASIDAWSICATSSLTLTTSNAKIQAYPTLMNAGTGTSLDMSTSNGAISATIQLASRTTASGTYEIRSTSSNGPMTLQLECALQSAALSLDAKTSNAPANVQLHPSFEGAFSLQTSNGPADVRAAHNSATQKQLQRFGPSVVRGTTVGNGQAMGRVNVTSSNAPAQLVL